ncbi:DUF2877 domain-containing protein [Tissierella sp. MB52-C2]|uniref:DUF2877 domain-containing protein n=1 Tax=Tissierella sp. MB52-C2 TaxID=3070999 RepID=UPI00280B261B|nr:DUF2877 domain-containing protein [Tissierella sp. MB52-C2]WMM24509.1 DUF2877 domain-containing protein [Tissierella sp. MB52-C2]
MRDKSFYALSYDKGLKTFIDTKNKNCNHVVGKVHSIFKKVINFVDDDNQIYSILQSSFDNGPYAVRIDNENIDDFFSLQIDINDLVFLENKVLRIENKLSINFDNVQLWSPMKLKIDIDKSNLELFKRNIEVYNHYLFHQGNYGGVKHCYIKTYMESPVSYKPTLIERELYKRVSNFITSIDSEYLNFKESIFSIIGLGNGLTPSGDDFLVGFMTALNVVEIEKTQALFRKIKYILRQNKLPTTDISISMINSCIEGNKREHLTDFIRKLFSEDKEGLLDSINNVFSIGSSSGVDLSVGVIIGLMYSLDILENGGI